MGQGSQGIRRKARLIRGDRYGVKTGHSGSWPTDMEQVGLTLPAALLCGGRRRVLGVFGVLVNGGAFPFFDGEAGLDAQDFGGLDARLGKLTQLRIGGGEPKRNDADIGRARRASRSGGTASAYRLHM